MLAHPTLDLLHALGLHGMAKGYQEIAAHPEARALDHAEWLGLLLEHEVTVRRQRRFETRARAVSIGVELGPRIGIQSGPLSCRASVSRA
jgi:hypothetical protein